MGNFAENLNLGNRFCPPPGNFKILAKAHNCSPGLNRKKYFLVSNESLYFSYYNPQNFTTALYFGSHVLIAEMYLFQVYQFWFSSPGFLLYFHNSLISSLPALPPVSHSFSCAPEFSWGVNPEGPAKGHKTFKVRGTSIVIIITSYWSPHPSHPTTLPRTSCCW